MNVLTTIRTISEKEKMSYYDVHSHVATLSRTIVLMFVFLLGLTVSLPSSANINSGDIQRYSQAMNAAANAKNIDNIAQLIADNAIISVNRNGVAGTMGKRAYLQKLQENWQYSNNYSYAIEVSNVVLIGKKAKAKIITTEVYSKDAQEIKQITESTVTLLSDDDKTVLLKAVSQLHFK